jgi:hypothetical protein
MTMLRNWLANIAHWRGLRLIRRGNWWLDVEEWLSTALSWRAIRGDGHGKAEGIAEQAEGSGGDDRDAPHAGD